MRRSVLPLVAVLGVALPAPADPPPRGSGLDVVPSTAFGFVTVRVGSLIDVDALKPIREALGKVEAGGPSLAGRFGMNIDEIERVTLFWPALPADPDQMTPVLVVTTREAYNEARVLKALKALPPGVRPDGGHGHGFGHGHNHGPDLVPPPEPKIDPKGFGPPGGTGFGPPGPSGFGQPGPKGFGQPGPASPPPTGFPAPGPFPTSPPKSPIPEGPREFPRPPSLPDGPGFIPKGSGPPLPGGEGAQVKEDAPAPGPAPAKPAAEPAPEPAAAYGPDLYYLEPGPYTAVFLLDDRTLVFLPTPEFDGATTLLNLVGQLLRKRADGPLAAALATADKHTVAAAFRISPIDRLLQQAGEMPRELAPFRSLLKAQTVSLTADVAERATVTARLSFADAAAARRAAPVLQTLIQLGMDELTELKKQGGLDQQWQAALVPLIDLARDAMDRAEVKADGPTVTARLDAEIGPAVAKAVAALPDLVRIETDRAKTLNNLKQIGIACHSFHDTMNYLPGNITSPDGKPLFSWRVAILPYLEQDNLFRALDLTKPYDDPRNAKVLAQMPDVFRVYGRDAEKGKTYLQMPSSPQPVPGGNPILVARQRRQLHTIPDGTSNTIMVVEAADAVDWAKPDDLTFNPQAAPKVGAPGRKWFYVLFGDGSVRALHRDRLTDAQLRALITVDGGEVVNIEERPPRAGTTGDFPAVRKSEAVK